jgi:hypothetical protein
MDMTETGEEAHGFRGCLHCSALSQDLVMSAETDMSEALCLMTLSVHLQ